MDNRIGELLILVGSNGTGKTTVMKKFLKVNDRNLIIPPNLHDTAWRGIKTLDINWKHRKDPRDSKQKRMIAYVEVQKLNSYKGDRLLECDSEEPEVFGAVTDKRTGFRNGGLFIDDFKHVIPSQGNLSGRIKKIFSNRRHVMLDIFMATHSFQDVNAEIFQYNPTLFIFKTTRGLNKSVRDKVRNFDTLVETVERVNKKAQENPYYFERFKVDAG